MSASVADVWSRPDPSALSPQSSCLRAMTGFDDAAFLSHTLDGSQRSGKEKNPARTVAVEDGADDAAVDDAGERLVARRQLHRRLQPARHPEAPQLEAVRI